MHEQVGCIEDKHIILPNVNIGLQGSNPPGVVGKKTFSSGVDSSRKPVPFARTTGIYLIECSSAQLLVQATIKQDMAPSKISVTESSSLTDLLGNILTYKPEDRFSLIDIRKHSWLTASVESTHEVPFASGELDAISINHV